MNYIILDMEWNQPWPDSPSARKVLPVHIRGEILQIGAVRMNEAREIESEYNVLILPKVYRRLNRRVSKLTGIKESMLQEQGIPFPLAVAEFQAWCGEDPVFLTWGFDDMGILKENLQLYNLPTDWIAHWFNAQMIFNAQTDGSTAQKALSKALEIMEIPPCRPAHDALGDAYHTALICQRLNLQQGIHQYESALKSHENGFHGAEIPGCLARHVYYDYADKWAALAAMAGEENHCPICNRQMLGSHWLAQPGHRYVDLASCPVDGKFLIRVRLSEQADGKVRVSRLTYEAGSEAAQNYSKRMERINQEGENRRRRRRKRPVKTAKEPAETE